MTDLSIWNDLDSTLNSLDVITSRLAGMKNINEDGDWSVSDTISDSSSHDTWYDAIKHSGSGSPALTEDSAFAVSPRSVVSENRGSHSSQSSSVGYHSGNQDVNAAWLHPFSDSSKWTVSSPKSKVHFDEMNLALTKSPTNFELTAAFEEFGENNNTVYGSLDNKPLTLKGIVKSNTVIPVTGEVKKGKVGLTL